MASIRAAGLRPIIGHTTDKTCRVWIRAGDLGDEGSKGMRPPQSSFFKVSM